MPDPTALLAVVGAHLPGMSLDHQLLRLDAAFERYTRTSPAYRLFHLPGAPPRPGLVRQPAGARGHAIEIGLWRLPVPALGFFLLEVPSPLALGTLFLEDGSSQLGFVCEDWATVDAQDISAWGGWRGYCRAHAS